MKKTLASLAAAALTIASSFAVTMTYNPIGFFTFDGNAEVNIAYSGSILEIGWYDHNNPTVMHSSVSSTTLGFFSSTDVISIWVKCLDNASNELIFTSTATGIPGTTLAGTLFLDNLDLFYIGGPMLNGGEFYSYSMSAKNWSGNGPVGEPLPGVLAALAIGGCVIAGKKIRSKMTR